MSKKRRATYGEMARVMAEMQQKMEQERQRMASVMADALLDEDAAEKLGEYSDADLRRIMYLLAGHIGDCVEQLEAEKQAKKDARPDAPVQQPQEQDSNPLTFIQR